jgi:hypothetical protein
MKYLQIEIGSWPKLPWWCEMLRNVIPAANPDLEKFFPLTKRWWVELDNEDRAKREIGFDAEGKAIVLGPIGRNYGFLVDTPEKWSDSIPSSEIRAEEFNEVWQRLRLKFKHLA